MLFKQCIGFYKTPPLWINEQFGITQFDFPKLDFKAFEPKPIPNRIRLGHQMEHVFRQLIAYSNAYDVLLYNLPVKSGKRTVGEIDFVLRDKSTKKLIHVELTYKFYIINPEISEPIHQLMGPNKRDMFFTKMEKIRNKQFTLLHTDEGKQALVENRINYLEVEHQVCYKAQLFYPYNSKSYYIRPLNKKCITGYWLSFKEFKKEEFKPYQYFIPFKAQWVIAPHESVQWRAHYETLLDINLRIVKENAPMIWIRKSKTEYEKVFVVWW